MAAKFFTGLPLDGPDPECVNGHGEALLAGVGAGTRPAPGDGPLPPAAPLASPGHVRPPLTPPDPSTRAVRQVVGPAPHAGSR